MPIAIHRNVHNHVARNLAKIQESAMVKEIESHGQRIKLYSSDNGRTWSSTPQSIIVYEQRKTRLRWELQKSFAQIDREPESQSNTEC